jgi:hypothetical protein
MQLPKGSFIKNGHLVTMESMMHQYDLSNDIGNPHVARDAIQTSDGLYIRGTLRHPEHKMLRLGEIWSKVNKNTAIGSWSASGNVD